MGADVLSRRELNRATLARQWLLARQSVSVIDAVRHLVGLQSQAPDAPYVGLWCRLTDFDPSELSALTQERKVVRLGLMRATVHAVTAADALQIRPLVQPVLDRDFKSQIYKRNLEGVDVDAVRAKGVALLEEQPLTRAQLGRLLAVDWPDRDPASLSYALSYLEPLVQVPPRGLWRAGGAAAHTTLPHWLGRPLDPAPSIDDVVLRYLAAFGPASVLDVQAWCGLTRLGEVVDRLRPQLRPFRSEDGRELFDLPDAPRPDPDVPAPPRFLPEYDNLLLSYADRRRCIPDGRKVPLYPGNGAKFGELLVDGEFRGTWRLDRDRATARLQIEPFAPLSAADRNAVEAEGHALLRFAAADHDHHDIAVTSLSAG